MKKTDIYENNSIPPQTYSYKVINNTKETFVVWEKL